MNTYPVSNFTTTTQNYADMNSQTPLIISFFSNLLKTASEVSVGMFNLITLFGEWIDNFTPHFMMDVINYPCWDQNLSMPIKLATVMIILG